MDYQNGNDYNRFGIINKKPVQELLDSEFDSAVLFLNTFQKHEKTSIDVLRNFLNNEFSINEISDQIFPQNDILIPQKQIHSTTADMSENARMIDTLFNSVIQNMQNSNTKNNNSHYTIQNVFDLLKDAVEQDSSIDQ